MRPVCFNGLYVILDQASLGKRNPVSVVRSMIRAGVRVLQYRAKGVGDAAVFETCKTLARYCRRSKVLFIVNDRPDIAFSSGADGVHLGTDDLPIAVARKALGPGKIVGLSSHSVAEALRQARKKPDYLALGPIFRSRTKKTRRRLVGLAALGRVAGRVHCPVVAIGGIDARTAGDAIAAGANSVAVVEAVLGARNSEKAARFLSQVIARSA